MGDPFQNQYDFWGQNQPFLKILLTIFKIMIFGRGALFIIFR